MIWENFAGAVVDGRFSLRTLTHAGRNQAEFIADSNLEAGARPLTLTLLAAAGEELTQSREQLSRVTQLQHPNLLEIVAGSWRLPSGEELLYLASETPDETLAAACPLNEGALLKVLKDVLNALEFLHERGLVHRGAEPQTIVRVGDRWKLADYGRLHRAGTPDLQIDSFLNGSRYTPPEAYSGLVLPAWDIWDLGSLVLEALTGRPDEGALPPPPFDALVRGCLEPSPETRVDLAGLRTILGLPKEPIELAGPPPIPEHASVPVAPEARVPDDRWQAPTAIRSRSSAGRKHWVLGAALIALVALVLAALFVTYGRPVQREPTITKDTPAPVRAPAAEPEAAPASVPAPVTSRAEVGMADYVSAGRRGARTASGELFDNRSLAAAHRTYRLGSRVRVTNLGNGHTVVVRINDRGLHRRGYVIRVTRRVAEKLNFASAGSAKVRVEALD